MLLSSPGPELFRIAAEEGATPVAVPMSRRPSPLQDAMSLFRMTASLRRTRPDIVIAGTPKAGLLAMIASAVLCIPTRVYLMRGLPLTTMTGPSRLAAREFERLACRLAHRVHCVSDSLMRYAASEGIASPAKMTVIRSGSSNGVDALGAYDPRRYDTAYRSALRAELGLPEDALVIGFVGRLARDKGVRDLQEAWCRIRAAHPRARLLAIGPEEAEDRPTLDAIGRLRSDARVHLVTDMREAAPYYLLMDVLVHPSHREGFPNVVLEASAMKVPVVTTDAIGCVDSVDDLTTGMIVPSRSPEAMAEAVNQYLLDASLRRRHGDAGRRRVLREFRPEAIWEATEASVRPG